VCFKEVIQAIAFCKCGLSAIAEILVILGKKMRKS